MKKIDRVTAVEKSVYQEMLDNMPGLLWRIDAQGRTVYVSRHIAKYGYSREAFLSGERSLMDLVQKDDRALLLDALRQGKPELSFCLMRADGCISLVTATFQACPDLPGGYDILLYPCYNASQQACETVLDNINAYVLTLHPETGSIIFANKAFKQAFEEQCEGDLCQLYLPVTMEFFQDILEKNQQNELSSNEDIFSDYTNEWLSVHVERATWMDGQDVFLVSCYDVTAQKIFAQSVEKQAYHDGLTGLPNRYRSDNDICEAMDRARMAGEKGFLLFIDLDDFKIVNDSFGHDYGDGVLIAFAEYLSENFEKPNRVYRFGGDEFVILLDYTCGSNIDKMLDMLHKRAKLPWQSMDRQFHCTLSIGVVEFTGNEDSSQTLIKYADIAMYEAKKSGKNKHAFYHAELGGAPLQRSYMEDLLRKAMRNGFAGFEIHYQPVLEGENIVGAEALVRLRDEEGQLLLPGQFLSLADYLGFMLPIGDFVLRSAVTQCRRIVKAGYSDFQMNINLSENQLQQKDIVQKTLCVLEEEKLLPHNVMLSVTEDIALRESARMLDVFRDLQAAGIATALDDFGGGNASFLRLRDLPIDMVKTAPALLTEDAYDFLALLIKLGHTMNKRICVNGVETLEQERLAEQAGADCLQGFLLHRPTSLRILNGLLF